MAPPCGSINFAPMVKRRLRRGEAASRLPYKSPPLHYCACSRAVLGKVLKFGPRVEYSGENGYLSSNFPNKLMKFQYSSRVLRWNWLLEFYFHNTAQEADDGCRDIYNQLSRLTLMPTYCHPGVYAEYQHNATPCQNNGGLTRYLLTPAIPVQFKL